MSYITINPFISRVLIMTSFATTIMFGCKKRDNPPPSPVVGTFKVSGVKDVVLETPLLSQINALLPIAVTLEANAPKETIGLTLSGAPTGVVASLQQTLITPPDNTNIEFSTGVFDHVLVGNYPMVLTAASASDTITYPFNVVIPMGWNVNNVFHTASSITAVPSTASTMPSYIELGSNNAGASTIKIIFNKGKALPTTDATFDLIDTPTADNEARIELTTDGNIFHSVVTSPKQSANVIVRNGQVYIEVSQMVVFDAVGSVLGLSCNIKMN